MNQQWINLAYLVSAVFFILGLKGLTRPKTAVSGNLLGAAGMLLAVVVTLLNEKIVSFPWILGGLLLGSAVGGVLAVRIQMTAMPQMVALLNGFGGIASVLVAGAELESVTERLQIAQLVATAASGLIGSVTFFGSLVAFAKLQEILFRKPVLFGGQQALNAGLAVAAVALGAWVCVADDPLIPYGLLVLTAAVLGVSLVVPIGGADMPVVIALLNSYSGLAAAATGFVLQNSMLIVAGSLVGASGVILTQIMCKAMNRSLFNVLFGVMGPAGGAQADDEVYRNVKSTSAEEIALLLDGARQVIFVPGYGLAVAQAQHVVRELAEHLEKRGANVLYAIHPVAGRMPGHMNVLLAEADIPYDKLLEMEKVNSLFAETDVVLVLGANDVVNPVARTDPNSPIAGMPILDVDKARTVVVVKRSMSPGFAGIPNPLFAADNALMFFADAKKGLLDVLQAIKEG